MDIPIIRLTQATNHRRTEFLTSTMVLAGFGFLVLSILVATAFYLLASYQDYTADDQFDSAEVLANLQEMQLRGDISEEELRTIHNKNPSSPFGILCKR